MAMSSRTTTSSTLKSTLMKDDSWIRRNEDEFEPIDRDPNFGQSVLSHYKSSENISRFSGSQDEMDSPYSKTRTSYTTSSPLSYNDPSTSTTTTTVTKNGKTTETTVTTSLRNTPTKTDTFTERVQSSSKGTLYSNFSPSKTTKVTETYVSSQKNAEDKLYDTLIPISIKSEIGDNRSSLTSTETLMVKRSINQTEDDLYDTLLPKSITSAQSSFYRGDSPTSLSSSSPLHSSSRTYTEDSPTTRITSYTVSSSSLPNDDYSKSYYYSSSKPGYEYSSMGNPNEYSSTSYRSSSNEILSTPITSTSSTKTVYTSPERTVLDRELCTSCHKPFTGDAKIVLDDMKINCHAFCFKCDVCNGTLGHMKAGDCMWVYNRMVHCESCFDVTREKWRH